MALWSAVFSYFEARILGVYCFAVMFRYGLEGVHVMPTVRTVAMFSSCLLLVMAALHVQPAQAQACSVDSIRVGGEPGDGFIGPTCNAEGSYRTTFYVTGSNLPAPAGSFYEVYLDGVLFPTIFFNAISADEFAVGISGATGDLSGVDVEVRVADGCGFVATDLYDAPSCACEITNIRLGGEPGDLYIGPTCNADGTFRTTFYLTGTRLPPLADPFYQADVEGVNIPVSLSVQPNGNEAVIALTGLSPFQGYMDFDFRLSNFCEARAPALLDSTSMCTCLPIEEQTACQETAEALLTVSKFVNNDNGGTLVTGDFPLFADGTPVVSGEPKGFAPGEYTVSETGDPGYQAEIGGDCTTDGAVTLELGSPRECSVTNDDIEPLLTVTKIVVNDDGGSSDVGDFELFVGLTPVTSATQNGFSAGDYVVSESNIPLYTPTISGDCDDVGNISLALGDVSACTITNDDIPPTLRLVKEVVNDNSGTLTTGDFNILLTGADGIHNAGTTYAHEDTPAIRGNVTYTVSEIPPEGYVIESIVCRDASDAVVGSGGQFVAVSGDAITCTVVNNDIPPDARFRVQKDFSDDNPGPVRVSIDCNTGLILDQDKFISEGTDVTFVVTSYDAGELDCSITESPLQDGYTASYAADMDQQGDSLAGSISADESGCHFEAVSGGHFVCTVVNELQDVALEVGKVWLGEFEAQGIERSATADWSCFNVRAGASGSAETAQGSLQFEGDSTDAVYIFPHWNGSSYCTVAEANLDGAIEPDASDCLSVPISVGQDASCTIRNVLFFEGIPTLGRHSLMLLALLALGLGMFGLRRMI